MQTTHADRAVVVGVDGSEHALEAVRWAAAEALLRRTPLRLVSAYAWPEMDPVGELFLGSDYRGLLRTAARERLDVAAQVAAGIAPECEIEKEVVQGFPAEALRAASIGAAVLVLGTRGAGGFAGLLTGSVTEDVVAHAAGPVVVVRTATPTATDLRARPVVLGVDGSPAGEAAVAFAFETAARRGAPLVAVHAWSDMMLDPLLEEALRFDDVAEHEVLAERLAGWAGKYPEVAVRQRLVRDRPARAIVDESRGAVLVVVGSRGRGGLAGLLTGSVSRAVLHHAHCPVAVVR